MWQFFLEHPWYVTGLILLLVWGGIELYVRITKSKDDDVKWKATRTMIFSLIKLFIRMKTMTMKKKPK